MNGLPFRVIDEQLGNNASYLAPSLPPKPVDEMKRPSNPE